MVMLILFCLPSESYGQSTAAVIEKRDEPTVEAVEAATKRIRRVYGVAKPTSDVAYLEEMISRLLVDAEQEKDSVLKFAFLNEARLFAISAGEAKYSLDITKTISVYYKIDELKLIESTLTNAVANSRKPQLPANLAVLQYMYTWSVKTGNLDMADRLIRLLAKTGFVDRAELNATNRELGELKKLKLGFDKSIELIRRHEATPKANEAVGKWFCYGVGNYEKGLHFLADGTNKKTRELARADIFVRKNQPKESYTIAQRWASFTAGREWFETKMARSRANKLFSTSLAGLESLERRRVEQLYEEFLAFDPVYERLGVDGRVNYKKHGWILGKYFTADFGDTNSFKQESFEQVILTTNGSCTFFVGHKFYSTNWTSLPDGFKVTLPDKWLVFQVGNNGSIIMKRVNRKTNDWWPSCTVLPLGFN